MSARPVVVVRYGEIGLKGGNRRLFERALARRLADALERHPHARIDRPHGRVLVREPRDPAAAARRAARVFGVTSASPGLAVDRDLDAMRAAAARLLRDDLARRGRPDGSGLSFRVEARRVDKRFAMSSVELNRELAGPLLEAHPGLRVDLCAPDVVLGVEVRDREALLHVERVSGPGGLPVGTLGRGVVLFSGGIDSPVAAWAAMKRGLEVELLHFHSPEFVGDASRQKAIDLARALSRWHPRLVLRIVPFSGVQVRVRDGAPEAYRTLLYRRSMNRIAARAAVAFGAGALVTGESLGQVASQTLENLACIEDAADRLVLRPLLCHDKHETIALARRIGTYDISIRPHPDCCTLFQPSKPKIHADRERVRRIDADLDLADEEERAWAARETVSVVDGRLAGEEAPEP